MAKKSPEDACKIGDLEMGLFLLDPLRVRDYIIFYYIGILTGQLLPKYPQIWLT